MNLKSFEAPSSAIDIPDPILHKKIVEQADSLTEHEMEEWFTLQGEWAQSSIEQWVSMVREQEADFNMTDEDKEALLGNRVMQMSPWFRTTIMLDKEWQQKLLSWRDNKQAVFTELNDLCPTDLSFNNLVSH